MPRRLRPKAGFGKRVYDAMQSRSDDDGATWEAEDLADCVGVSAKTVRSWIVRGVIPLGDNLDRLADCLDTSVEEVLKGPQPVDKSDKSGTEQTFAENEVPDYHLPGTEVIQMIAERPDEYTRRLDTMVDEGMPLNAILGWIRFGEEMGKEKFGFNFKPILDPLRERVRERHKARTKPSN
jgi:hypothetical protein